MNWTRFALAVVVSGAAISLSDWFFFGVLFHDKYMETPELWRASGEGKKIAWSTALAVLGSAAFLYLCVRLGVHGLAPALEDALLVWVAAPLPITLTNTLYVRYNPLLAVSHSAGWLARLVISALAYAWLLA